MPSSKPTVNRDGVDLLFGKRTTGRKAENEKPEKPDFVKGREHESQNVRIAGKEKEGFYLAQETIDAIETLRTRLRREYGLSRRSTSKSAIVDAAIGALLRNPEMLAAWLRAYR